MSKILRLNGAIVVNEAVTHDVIREYVAAVPNRRSWQPAWLHEGGVRPPDEHLLEAWSTAVAEWPGATVHFAPPVALGWHQNTAEPIVYARWQAGAGAPQLNSLAILSDRNIEVSLLSLLRLRARLRSRRVIESSLVGDDSPAALDAFLNALIHYLSVSDLQCIAFPDIDSESPMRAALLRIGKHPQVVSVSPAEPAPHWWIRFPEKPEEYWSQFSKKTRYNFRYRAKHLEHTVKCIHRKEDVPEMVDRITTLAEATWQQNRLGVRMIPERKLELWRAIAELGALRSYLLLQGDRTLSFAVGFQWKGHFIYDDTGYDPAFATQSPGQVLLYRMIEDLIARDTPKLFDFGYGDGEYKRIYANHQTMSGPMMIVKRALAPMAIMALGKLNTSIGRHARSLLAKTRTLSLLRHIHRGHA